jgi:peroxiredoxin Q/BCP
MPTVKLNNKVPNFTATITDKSQIKLSNYLGKNIVIYFYPRDNTPGCTKEGEEFRDNHQSFKDNNTVILGVSKDSVSSHNKFSSKYNFPFDLISDENEKVCKLFNVIKEKSMYGRKYMGIERSTFIINTKGKLTHEWRKVKVKGHVEEVLKIIKDIPA